MILLHWLNRAFFGYTLLKGTLGIGNFQFTDDVYVGREVATEKEQKLLYFIEEIASAVPNRPYGNTASLPHLLI